ncbi:class I SAM-dependent methyltransferase [Elusimicrobiota bacterium]
MNKNDRALWERLSKIDGARSHIDDILGTYKSDEFVRLISEWVGSISGCKVLKTDLREESDGEDEVLYTLSRQDAEFFGIDISSETAQRADMLQQKMGLSHNYVAADVRAVPFSDDTFDVIISTSTLDHFKKDSDLMLSLIELKRVLKPGGKMVLTLNNKYNVNFYVMVKLERMLGLINYPVRFYTFTRLKKMLDKAGLIVNNKDFIIHVVSPANTLLLLTRKIFDARCVNVVSGIFLRLARWFGRRNTTKRYTGWFIAVLCSK